MKVIGSKIKVTGAKKVENSYFRNAKLRSAITPVLQNRVVMFACSMGFNYGYGGSNGVTAICVT